MKHYQNKFDKISKLYWGKWYIWLSSVWLLGIWLISNKLAPDSVISGILSVVFFLSIYITVSMVILTFVVDIPTFFRSGKGKIDKDKQIIENFQDTLKKHIDQLFGIRLYYEGIKYEYGNDDVTMKITTQHFENIMERGEKMVSDASELLQRVQEGNTNAEELENFEFLPISGHPGLDDMTVRAKLLVEAYERLFPNRPREMQLTRDEHYLLLNEVTKYF